MSQRGKRNNSRFDNDSGHQPPSKRRKGRPPIGSNASATDPDHHSDFITPAHPTASAGVHPSPAPSSGTSTMWQARSISDLKLSSIYNRSSSEAPAELFRKDLISAMKLPDSEPLSSDEYWTITDQWKQEWEKGVQVPVNPDSLPEPSVKLLQHPIVQSRHDFKLPKHKYVRITKDDSFNPELHYLSNVPSLAETACAYDLDQTDEVWLKLVNKERAMCGLPSITDSQFERVIEELEIRCWDKIQAIMRSEEGLGIEFDENVICDVCRSPDSEEANEMVFCDNCNICVHQACYGITAIPSGQWLCRTCSMGKKPDCALCPNKGGAMKSTKSGKKWAHVSCALWIPEVSIGCVDRMEPITKISSIPQSRWALICVLCRERVGACIQCSVKTCKTAYHVTCAFQHGLEMRAIIEEGNSEDGVKLRSYCQKHSMSKGKKDKSITNNGGNSGAIGSGSEDEDNRKRKIRKDMTSEERNQVRVLRLQEVESEFDKHVNIKDISCHLLEVDQEAILSIYNYWILKRKSRNNRSLIPPKAEEVDVLSNQQEEADIEKRKMVVHLRQDLERVRNLCYMVNRREKLSRTLFKMREQIFYKQIAVLSENINNIKDHEFVNAVIHANNGPSVYDRLYSSGLNILEGQNMNFEEIQEKIQGCKKLEDDSGHSSSRNYSKTYKKMKLNGILDRKSDSVYGDSCFSSNSDNDKSSSSSSSSSGENKNVVSKKKTQSYSKTLENKRRTKQKSAVAVSEGEDSSSDDQQENKKGSPKKNTSLQQMERELAKEKGHALSSSSSNESDELLPMKSNTNFNKTVNKKPIYSDSSDSDSSEKSRTDNTVSDSQHQLFRTKAELKEFTLNSNKGRQEVKRRMSTTTKSKQVEKIKTTTNRKLDSTLSSTRKAEKLKNCKEKEKEKIGRKKSKSLHSSTEDQETKTKTSYSSKYNEKNVENKKFPTDLMVVPQRQAAKKASENMRSTNLHTTPIISSKKETQKSIDDQVSVTKEKREDERDRDTREQKDKDKDKEKEKEKEKEREKVRGRGRPPKQLKDETSKEKQKEQKKRKERRRRTKSKSNEISPTRNNSSSRSKGGNKVSNNNSNQDNNLLVAYVPQRQAAKKAAEHIKSGLIKNASSEIGNTVGASTDEKDISKIEHKEKVSSEKDIDKVLEKDKRIEKSVAINKEKQPPNLDKDKDKIKETIESLKTDKMKEVEKPPELVLSSSSSDSTSCSSSCSSSSSSSEGSDDEEEKNEKIEIPRKLIDKNQNTCSSSGPIENKKNNNNNDVIELIKEEEKEDVNQEEHQSKVTVINKSEENQQKNVSLSNRLEEKSEISTAPKEQNLPERKGIVFDIHSNHLSKFKKTFSPCDDSFTPVKPNESKISVFNETNTKAIHKDGLPALTEKSSTLSPKNQLSKEIQRSPIPVVKEQTKTLEEEIAQRKADLISLSNISNKINRNACVLDKLLDKKEKERKAQEFLAKPTPQQTNNKNNNNNRDDLSKIIPSTTIHPADVKENMVDMDMISINSESIENVKTMKNNMNPEIINKMIPMQQFNETGSGINENVYNNPDMNFSSTSQPLKPFNKNEDNTVLDVGKEFLNDCEKPDKIMGLVNEHSDLILRTPLPCEFNTEPIFEIKQNEEDSARETMNLVEKLRQKYKRTSSTSGTKPEEPVPTENKCSELKVEASNDEYHQLSQHNDDISFHDRIKSTNDTSSVAASMESTLNVNRSLNNLLKYNQSNIYLNKNDSTSNIPQIPIKDQQLPQSQHCSQFMSNKLEIENHMKPTLIGNQQQQNCFDTIASSNFFKHDFVEMNNKNHLDIHQHSKIDCNDYDDNPPYLNPNHIWNENELIQTRRSVSSSPSTISESNDLNVMQQQQSQPPPQQQQQLPQSQPINKTSQLNNNFNNMESYPMQSPQQFQHLQQQQQHQHPPMAPAHSAPIPNGIGVNITAPFNYSNSGNQFNGPVSLFPPPLPPQQQVPNLNIQMPYPSPGAGLYASQLSGNVSIPGQNSQFSHIAKPHQQMTDSTPFSLLSQNCMGTTGISSGSGGAAFTSSSHNLALTAAIVSTAAAAALPSPAPQRVQGPSSQQTSSVVDQNMTMPSVSQIGIHHSNTFNNILSNVQDRHLAPPPPPPAINQMLSCSDPKESPSKRTLTSRYNSQITSPKMHKSPGKSPRQMELLNKQNVPLNSQKITKYESTSNVNRQQKVRSTRGSNGGRVRGRGRGRGRGANSSSIYNAMAQMTPTLEFDNHLSSIQNSLAGTVYDLDFDEDFSSCHVENLKSLRDRRRSFDYRMNAHTTPDQKFSSPNYQNKIRNSGSNTGPRTSSVSSSLIDLKPPSIHENNNQIHNSLLHNMVHPVLPGPVDMRTYSSGYENQTSTSSQEAYNSHLLGAFATGTADQTLHEIDEEVEKEFQSALKASVTVKAKLPLPTVIPPELQTSMEATSEEISIDSDTMTTKVSLSDSRNQLKLKIKGPLAHPDMYNTSTVCNNMHSNLGTSSINMQMPSVSQGSTGSSTGGTSSLRRMRKKELLRQYWTQDMNMDDSACLSTSVESKTTNDQIINRSVGIPKAVDSMSSIPTKDDYKDYTAIDPRKRRKALALSRELRQLDAPFDADRQERRRSVCSSGSNISGTNLGDNGKITGKRRGKGKSGELNNSNNEGAEGSLKIKIRNNAVETSDRRLSGCPPKKRLSNVILPTLETLKRDCMNFRKQVMANFDEEEEQAKKSKTKAKKEHKTSHKKKKKEKCDEMMQIIENNVEPSKIVIRIGKRKIQEDSVNNPEQEKSTLIVTDRNNSSVASNVSAPEKQEKPIVPIRLKIARASDGDGYVIGGGKSTISSDTSEKQNKSDLSSNQDSKDQQQQQQQSLLPASTNRELDENQKQTSISDLHPLDNQTTAINPGAHQKTENQQNISAPTESQVHQGEQQQKDNSSSDLKGPNQSLQNCPLLPLNKDCEVR